MDNRELVINPVPSSPTGGVTFPESGTDSADRLDFMNLARLGGNIYVAAKQTKRPSGSKATAPTVPSEDRQPEAPTFAPKGKMGSALFLSALVGVLAFFVFGRNGTAAFVAAIVAFVFSVFFLRS